MTVTPDAPESPIHASHDRTSDADSDAAEAVDLAAARAWLLAERTTLLATLASQLDESVRRPSDVPDGIGETEHLVTAQQFELSGRLAAMTQDSLSQVEAAIERLNAGSYGICTECGEPIIADRLIAIPHAACCVQCQSALDHRR